MDKFFIIAWLLTAVSYAGDSGEQKVHMVWDRTCVESIEPSLDYRMSAPVDSVTGEPIMAKMKEDRGHIVVKLAKGCKPYLEVYREK